MNRSREPSAVSNIVSWMIASQLYHPLHSNLHFSSRLGYLQRYPSWAEARTKQMLEIHPNLLWIGHALDVRTPQPIFDLGITAVVDVAFEETCAQLPRQLIYCRFPLNDGGGNETTVIDQTLRTVIRFLESNTKTLLACSAGMSRSPTIAAFALAYHLNETPDAAIARIAKLKGLELKQPFWDDVLTAFRKLKPLPEIDG